MIASENAHKLAEMQAYFTQEQLPITVVLPQSLEGIEETGETFIANAVLKVAFAHQQAKEAGCQWVLGDDSGFSVAALAGQFGLPLFPGVQSNRWLTPARRAHLLGDTASPLESPITHPQRANPLGPVNLVRGHGDHIRPLRDGDAAKALHRVT